MTQEQLGDATGLTPVHVNRTLQKLCSDRLITRDKRAITIENWKALAGVADFNAGYLHLNDAREFSFASYEERLNT